MKKDLINEDLIKTMRKLIISIGEPANEEQRILLEKAKDVLKKANTAKASKRLSQDVVDFLETVINSDYVKAFVAAACKKLVSAVKGKIKSLDHKEIIDEKEEPGNEK